MRNFLPQWVLDLPFATPGHKEYLFVCSWLDELGQWPVREDHS